jgi:hypothetical protein
MQNSLSKVVKTAFAAGLIFLSACSGSSGGGSSYPLPSGDNVVYFTAAASGYVNEPVVTVTICSPTDNTCQSIPNVLLDTGSYGLRLFSSVITVSLPTITVSGGNELAECQVFGTGSTWGPVKSAKVVLGNEPAVTVQIQVIQSTYAAIPAGTTNYNCADADTSPSAAGYNGILGVGMSTYDCGSYCTTTTNNLNYYSCPTPFNSGNSCSGNIAILSKQVTNPVAALSSDNNGVVLVTPPISNSGADSVMGAMVMGIGTRSNNTPDITTVTTFPANSYNEFTTVFNGTTLSASFIDSGSNGLYFPSTLTQCGGSYTTFYCPTVGTNLTATNKGTSGTPTGTVSFQIGNTITLLNTGYSIFNNLGGYSAASNNYFDWGLPFFFGKTVYVGFSGQTSTLGTGPFWAY